MHAEEAPRMPDLLHPEEGDEEPVQETPDDPGAFALADTADDQLEAELLARACEEEGIAAIVEDPRQGVVGKLASPVDSFRILVPERDLERAREILRARRDALEADPEGAERAALEEEESGRSNPR
jgi:Putative prokaryotic signal transducing protein